MPPSAGCRGDRAIGPRVRTEMDAADVDLDAQGRSADPGGARARRRSGGTMPARTNPLALGAAESPRTAEVAWRRPLPPSVPMGGGGTFRVDGAVDATVDGAPLELEQLCQRSDGVCPQDGCSPEGGPDPVGPQPGPMGRGCSGRRWRSGANHPGGQRGQRPRLVGCRRWGQGGPWSLRPARRLVGHGPVRADSGPQRGWHRPERGYGGRLRRVLRRS